MRIEILDLAIDDLIDGYRFYEERESGLGEYFLSGLISDIESLAVFGGMHRRFYRRFHRLLSKRFPFAVYYTVEGDVARIRAHARRLHSPAARQALQGQLQRTGERGGVASPGNPGGYFWAG